MKTLNQQRAQALTALRGADYSASRHPEWDDCVVVADPVRCDDGEGNKYIGVKHTTVRILDVYKFINDRS